MLKITRQYEVTSTHGEGTGLITCTVPHFQHIHPLADYFIGNVRLQLCAQHNDVLDFLQEDADVTLPAGHLRHSGGCRGAESILVPILDTR